MFSIFRFIFIVFILLISSSVLALTEKQFNDYEVEGLRMQYSLEKLQQILKRNAYSLIKESKNKNIKNYVYRKKIKKKVFYINLFYSLNRPDDPLIKMVIKSPNLDKEKGIKKEKQKLLKTFPDAKLQCNQFIKTIVCKFRGQTGNDRLLLNISVNNKKRVFTFQKKKLKKKKPKKPPSPIIPPSPWESTSSGEQSDTPPEKSQQESTSESDTKSRQKRQTETKKSQQKKSETEKESKQQQSEQNSQSMKEQAEKLIFEKQAASGDAEAQYRLGLKLEQTGGKSKANETALELFKKAAAQGHAKAQYKLSQMYDQGKGVKKNQRKSIQMLKDSAGQEYAPAAFDLAMRYLKGRGVEQDDQQAFHWFEVAAKNEDAQASYTVARMYESGLGVNKDLQKADEWYQKAANLGHIKSMQKTGIKGGREFESEQGFTFMGSGQVPY